KPIRTVEPVGFITSHFDRFVPMLHQEEALRPEPAGLTKRYMRRDFVSAGFLWLPFGHHKTVKMAGIRFRSIRNGSSPSRCLHIHANETTARQVLTDHLTRAHGTAWIIDGDQRLVDFRAGKLDPNRMFSRDGADRNLRRLNPRWSEARILNGLLVLD